jgi:glycerol-3-phosphate dehydrogenase (NAD+)
MHKARIISFNLAKSIFDAFCERLGDRPETYLESCGFADLVTTCYSGRNRRIAEVFVTAEGKVLHDLISYGLCVM